MNRKESRRANEALSRRGLELLRATDRWRIKMQSDSALWSEVPTPRKWLERRRLWAPVRLCGRATGHTVQADRVVDIAYLTRTAHVLSEKEKHGAFLGSLAIVRIPAIHGAVRLGLYSKHA